MSKTQIKSIIKMKTVIIGFTLILFPFKALAMPDTTECDKKYYEHLKLHKLREGLLINEELPILIGGFKKLAEKLTYSDSARVAGIEGTVFTWFLVDTNGTVKCSRVIKGLGYGLDEAALRVVKEAKFKAVEIKGKRYEKAMILPIRFTLKKNDNKK